MTDREQGPDDDLVDDYRADGFVVLRHVFSADEASAMAAECDRLAGISEAFHADNLRALVLNSTRAPDRLDPVVDLSPVFAAAARDRRLVALARALLGDEPLLFKDKLILKPAGAAGYGAHQDYAYWHWLPAPAAGLLTLLVAIDAATPENGAVELFPGQHHRLLTPTGAPADVDEATLGSARLVVGTEPGDVVAFHSLTPHRSGPNRSASARRQLYLSYGAAAHGDLYRSYYEGLHRSLTERMAPEVRARAFFR